MLRWSRRHSTPRHPRDPNDPAYRWPAEVTRSVAEAKKYGMQVALMLIFAPRWANGNKPPKWATFKRRDFDDFAVAASRRYPSVHLWMIWGEPSRAVNFYPNFRERPGSSRLTTRQATGPRLYARLLKIHSPTRACSVTGTSSRKLRI